MRIVQFMHPGDEIKVCGSQVPWNSGKHKRRLLRHLGCYIAGDNIAREGDLCFWNEYEAPTIATAINPPSTGWEYAHHYHRIVQPIPLFHGKRNNDQDECCSNTDPCVFGDTFKYSNCQQVPNGDLWNLPEGSLILFGSLHGGCFYLDTVFVTNDLGVQYSVPISKHPHPFTTSKEYKIVTLDNIKPRKNNRSKNSANPIIDKFMFYRGKLPVVNNRRVDDNDIFSFSPARIFGDLGYNERCKIDLSFLNALFQNLPGWRNFSSALNRKHKAITFNAGQVDVAAVWHAVRDAVRSASFELGYHFPW